MPLFAEYSAFQCCYGLLRKDLRNVSFSREKGTKEIKGFPVLERVWRGLSVKQQLTRSGHAFENSSGQLRSPRLERDAEAR